MSFWIGWKATGREARSQKPSSPPTRVGFTYKSWLEGFDQSWIAPAGAFQPLVQADSGWNPQEPRVLPARCRARPSLRASLRRARRLLQPARELLPGCPAGRLSESPRGGRKGAPDRRHPARSAYRFSRGPRRLLLGMGARWKRTSGARLRSTRTTPWRTCGTPGFSPTTGNGMRRRLPRPREPATLTRFR